MKFKAPQAQEAYEEVLREAGKAITELVNMGNRLAAENPGSSTAILLSVHGTATAARVNATAEAIRVGTEVDQRWTSLAAHIAMEVQS